MSVPDVLSMIRSNIESYHSLHDASVDSVTIRKGGPLQIDEDADIYFGYYEKSDTTTEKD